MAPIFSTAYLIFGRIAYEDLPTQPNGALTIDSMANNIVKELEAAKAKVVALTESLQKELNQKLAGLPAEFGFDDLNSFIAALKSASGAPSKRGRGKGKAAKPEKKGKRARITPEIKDQVKALVKAEKTGAEIAKELGISLPSVQNIKKELGLVKARK